MTRWLACAALIGVAPGCPSGAATAPAFGLASPGAPADEALRADSGPAVAPSPACDGPALSRGDLTLEWEEEETVRHLELRVERITLDGADVARVAGSCILGADGHVLRAVAASGAVAGGGAEPLGKLTPRASIRVDGTNVPVGFVLVDAHGVGWAISDSGDPFVLPGKVPPFPAVGHVDGDVMRAKRTALVLWQLGPTLSRGGR